MSLNWDSTYEVAIALHRTRPTTNLDTVTLQDIFDWTMALPDFGDEASLCNDEILQSIIQEWYEVTINA